MTPQTEFVSHLQIVDEFTIGYDVRGAFMKNWDLIDEAGYCTGEQDWLDAQKLCRRLGIPLEQVNFVKDYWLEVFGSFLKDYEAGITPNPDILCNRHIKFNLFYKYARERMGADAIATGHYARTNFGPFLEKYNDPQQVRLLVGTDDIKDQTFFLSQISAEALRRTMFPIGGMNKSKVKQIAIEVGLEFFARKKESMGICFVGKRSFQDFIVDYIDTKPGDFVDFDTGKVVGRHNGFHNWTIGQGAKIASCLQPYYIFQKHIESNNIYVVSGHDHPLLLTDMVYAECPIWINRPAELKTGIWRCQFRFQHTKPLVDCSVVETGHERLFVKLDRSLRAITPGQYAVFYKKDECFGSARIVRPGPSMVYS
ncbi:mitochondrial tRNA-specific 2-thiouridylase 1 isoform X2 [Toxorhynchites rutilus septentrionalis]|uniref:mitochondrial tRNA-specific 2-thiouridylase 1 isoform X2 n=1 Tax=Toxorhynchites rutilus septentrionalis TaxID=329112 RepID=UPI002478C2A8|nr:mitochondrial tRNA-specific 2-thiouridylase 1 isoform X2 [Toxorhynchites rutilus septentrionalis]